MPLSANQSRPKTFIGASKTQHHFTGVGGVPPHPQIGALPPPLIVCGPAVPLPLCLHTCVSAPCPCPGVCALPPLSPHMCVVPVTCCGP